jgi:hypothetical protein
MGTYVQTVNERSERKMTKHNIPESVANLERYGISRYDGFALRRIAMTLHRWHELECGNGNEYRSWCIERQPDRRGVMRPFMVSCWHDRPADRMYTSERIADRETGALKRLAAIMGEYPRLAAYVQGDPRGAALYVYEKARLPTDYSIDSMYSSIGCAVYA